MISRKSLCFPSRGSMRAVFDLSDKEEEEKEKEEEEEEEEEEEK